MISSQFNIENYYNQKIMFGKNGYALFNLFFMEALKKDLSRTKKQQDVICNMLHGLDEFYYENEIRIIRIWTNKKISITLDKMLDDNTYYIFEGMDYHPGLKNKIINYLKDVPFYNATIWMQKQQLKDYQEYAANAYRLSQKFIDNSRPKYFEESKNFVRGELKLDVKQEDVSLAIIYSSSQISKYNDGSEIFGKYYKDGENVLQTYSELKPCQ